MVFSSALFLFLYLPMVVGIYFCLPGMRLRNVWLLMASLVFYAWGETLYVLVMIASIGFNTLMGVLVALTRATPRRHHLALAIAIIGNLGMLAWYKYATFLVDTLNDLAGLLLDREPLLSLDPVHLPIGISFFTFQAMSYVIDVYRKEVQVCKNPLDVGLYISMFPQLIAGPIVRYQQVAHELRHRTTSLSDVAAGIRIFTVGLGKKLLLANTFARIADEVFALAPGDLSTAAAWTGILTYTLQIYFDFSGYSDMAIGLGRIFGFHFPINFKYPYIATSIRDFWQRWHISLSSWLRDYLYIPLGGSRGSKTRTYVNLYTVFLLCGLWHGASWNFILWGFYHGMFLMMERIWSARVQVSFPRWISHGYVLLTVMGGWVLFRTETLTEAAHYFSTLSGVISSTSITTPLQRWWTTPVLPTFVVATVACTPFGHVMREKWIQRNVAFSWIEVTLQVSVWIACASFLAKGTHNPFIYFRF